MIREGPNRIPFKGNRCRALFECSLTAFLLFGVEPMTGIEPAYQLGKSIRGVRGRLIRVSAVCVVVQRYRSDQ